jgi:hypothetical protein
MQFFFKNRTIIIVEIWKFDGRIVPWIDIDRGGLMVEEVHSVVPLILRCYAGAFNIAPDSIIKTTLH